MYSLLKNYLQATMYIKNKQKVFTILFIVVHVYDFEINYDDTSNKNNNNQDNSNDSNNDIIINNNIPVCFLCL